MTPTPAQLEAMWEYVRAQADAWKEPHYPNLTPEEERAARHVRNKRRALLAAAETPPPREPRPHYEIAFESCRCPGCERVRNIDFEKNVSAPRPSEGSRSVAPTLEERLEEWARYEPGDVAATRWSDVQQVLRDSLTTIRLYREEIGRADSAYDRLMRDAQKIEAERDEARRERDEARERIEKALAAIEAWPTDTFRDRFGAILRGIDTTRETK